ncbi:bifunctional dTDP-4-dehydrorhamnose 3,5-epimerase family protein/NAD(P)-dependent oxidoreductase [Nocardioides sp. cx-173]|uniref:sugar nucleotide-binding protein n=1 Tax=Nocardioides sp. cx-173 TaxID=2898796 RepID=UPI001E38638F|nr:bifunctional dTDP-4-dehydrorhamnose 3,5-epimerase family protein/NAD(P)-dependent oxidoreductase [Nocardioides sp. cx-173]MCD4526956.1 bifunctional dTDP-4-dehydrorhamnose 3,5-epimerase family protein/NAD(P)-dependent oxidoreductase [Nocardioides sp. cx-173]UGB41256.1 bifunctional dTDP-4-dehydrorhamnose 3,5-epimerase family protein/NAD(P)-dependent oxidoreductase [Nocardioides sp. cx-173]
MPDLTIETTPIPGLLVVHLDLREDARGFFKENWQREKMVALGLPDFGPVQNNISFNATRGATRGIHTEPWDKFVSVANGRIFAAWVDMREGGSFGATFHVEMDPSVAVFVPRGVGNSYQTLEDGVAYSYLVNEHWRPGTAYPALNLADETAAIPWPIPLAESEISEKDLHNPFFADVVPMGPKKTLIVGALGQLGRALQADFPGADLVDLAELDLTDAAAVAAWPWHEYELVLNAAAYTAVDAAETPEGRRSCWAANAAAPATLARLSEAHGFTLVHFSSEYVFDGTVPEHTEDEPLSPLGVYAQTKAAGDLAVGTARRHYILRTSWVIGEGNNFVRTMRRLAEQGVSPDVVSDQIGRLTFTSELSRATRHLLDTGAPYGTYHCSNAGPAMSWADIAAAVYELSGRSADDVHPITTEQYGAGKSLSPRPASSTMSLAKLRATGFEPREQLPALRDYLAADGPA